MGFREIFAHIRCKYYNTRAYALSIKRAPYTRARAGNSINFAIFTYTKAFKNRKTRRLQASGGQKSIEHDILQRLVFFKSKFTKAGNIRTGDRLVRKPLRRENNFGRITKVLDIR